MAIIIRKNKATEAVAQPMTLSRVMSFTRIFNPTDSIKPLIEIKIGIDGHATHKDGTPLGTLDLGVQGEHHVKWIKIDLTELRWGTNANPNYIYKLIFESTTEPAIHFEYPFECDQTGGIFKIPSTITKYAHIYRIALVIVENIEPTNEGNLPTHTEVFSSYAWEGAVKKSFFDLNAIKRALSLESDQLQGLTKSVIEVALGDNEKAEVIKDISGNNFAYLINGELSLTPRSIGVRNDRFIRYFKLSSMYLTSKLDDFDLYLCFEKDGYVYSTKFQELPNNDEGKDDYSAESPLIAWVHPAVYRSAGNWNMCVVATTEDITTGNDYATGDFYRFISSTLVGIIDNTGLRYRGQDTNSTIDDTAYLMSNDEKALESNDGLTIDAAKIGSMEEDW